MQALQYSSTNSKKVGKALVVKKYVSESTGVYYALTDLRKVVESMTKDEEFMTVEEASAFLGISRRTLERYTTAGRIGRYRRGIRVYYKRTDVERLARELSEYQPEDTQDD
jgi:excisionase family DNA binding protein